MGDIEKAKDDAFRAAFALGQANGSGLTAKIFDSAERAILRRLVCRVLAMSEAEYWRMVEEEIKR